MDVKYYSIEVSHNGEKIKADCQEFQVMKYPQVRVCIDRGRKLPLIYTFYKTMPQNLFWFKLPNPQNELLEKRISDAILKLMQTAQTSKI